MVDPWNIIGWIILTAFALFVMFVIFDANAHFLYKKYISLLWYFQGRTRSQIPNKNDIWASPIYYNYLTIYSVDPFRIEYHEAHIFKDMSEDEWDKLVKEKRLVKIRKSRMRDYLLNKLVHGWRT